MPSRHPRFRHFVAILIFSLLGPSLSLAQQSDRRLRVGVTLHPYYSFVANVVGDAADIVPLIDTGANPHGYQPRSADIVRAQSLDALVVNGVGHDQWAFEIVKAAGRTDSLPLIYANATVALIPVAGTQSNEAVVNPHTFIATTAAVQQVYEIARRLAEIDPTNGALYRSNAQLYAMDIRRLRASFMEKFATLDAADFHAATVHAGYDYLFSEFGLKIEAVIEPRHGVNPTAAQLAQTLQAIRTSGVNVLFTERYFEGELAETIQNETGVRVYSISHIDGGEYTQEKFIAEMRANIETVLKAVEDTRAK